MHQADSRPQPKYWADLNQSKGHRVQLDYVPAGSRVLEIGAAGGHMTQALSNKGCEVTAVEQDAELAQSASRFCQRMMVADVEDLDFETCLEGQQFDVVLLGDVLEHLKNPETLLRRLRPHLSPRGQLVVCLPNVAHGAVRLGLLQGHFDYQSQGLLDRTHLRFFTLASLSSMFADAGYTISDLFRLRVPFFATEIPIDPASVPSAVLRILCRDPDTVTYQFVFRAHPHAPAIPKREADPPPIPATSMGASELTAEGLHQDVLDEYERLGRKALFEKPPDIFRARKLLYCAFGLAPSLRRLNRLCASYLPYRLFQALDRIHTGVHRRRGSP